MTPQIIISHLKDSAFLQIEFLKSAAGALWLLVLIADIGISAITSSYNSIFSTAILSTLNFAIVTIYQDTLYHQDPTWPRVWSNIRLKFWRFIASFFYTSVWSMVYLLPTFALIIFAASKFISGNNALIASIVIASPVFVWVLCRYFPIVYFAVITHPHAPLSELRKLSVHSMNGKKLRFFLGFVVIFITLFIIALVLSDLKRVNDFIVGVGGLIFSMFQFVFFQKSAARHAAID